MGKTPVLAQQAENHQGNLGGAPGVTVISVFPGEYDFSGPYGRPLQGGIYRILPPERAVITSVLDGEDIEMGLHLPDTHERVPVVVLASPYFFDVPADGVLIPHGEVISPAPGSLWQHLIEILVPHGYAVVGLAVRGTGGSGGCNDYMGPAEEADLDQAITWLGTQPWSTGAVGMFGQSYDGSTPWMVAATGNPYLRTIVPANGVVDAFADAFQNGTVVHGAGGGRNSLYYGLAAGQPSGSPIQRADRIACPDGLMGVVAHSRMLLEGGADGMGYWDARDRRARVLENYQGSVFAVHGLRDDNAQPSQFIPFIDHLEQSGIRVKQMYGQYEHNYPGIVGGSPGRQEIAKLHRADFYEVLLRWLDRELKSLDIDVGVPAQVTDDLGRWRNEAHYPPRDASWERLHLAEGRMVAEPPGPAKVTLLPGRTIQVLTCRQQTQDLPGEVAEFVLPPAEDDLLIAGRPRLHVATTPHSADGTLQAVICERTADGTTRFIGRTTMDLEYADGTRQPRPVQPGATIRAMMEIEPVDAVVRAGNELVLRVGMLNAPTLAPAVMPAAADLELGHSIPSTIELPRIHRAPQVYFEPPRPIS